MFSGSGGGERVGEGRREAYPLKMFPFLLPWAMDEVPDDAYERMRTTVPPGYGLMLRLFSPRYRRGEQRAFRYV